MLLDYPVKKNVASLTGDKYLTANGKDIPNRGEQLVKFLTQEQHRCALTFQVTDVTKPLLSVSQLAATGHKVHFDEKGGTIRHEKSGREIKLIRRSGLYILRIWVEPGSKSAEAQNDGSKTTGFTRPGARR